MRLRPGIVVTGVRAGLIAVGLARLATAARRPPSLIAAHGAPDATDPSITVVIPARDEASRIGPVLAAVIGAPGVGRVIVVDDHSSDGTAEVARAAGAEVISAPELPDGWAGKAWALQVGLGAAETDWVVTLDADTDPDPALAVSMVRRAVADDVAMLTVGGAFVCPSGGAQWLHPAMLTTLVYRFGAPGTETRPDRVMANGQAMALEREPILALGGLGCVAGQPVEDVALARAVALAGLGVGFVEGSALLAVRMYETAAETATGWGRSIALGGVEPLGRQLFDAAVVIAAQAGASWSLVRLIASPTGPIRRRGPVTGALALVLDIAVVAARLGTLAGTRRSYRADRPVQRLAYWVSPSADLGAAVLLVRSALSRRQSWRGRSYRPVRPGRSADR